MNDPDATPAIASPIDPKDNPYFAPADGRCIVNDLPAELLSQIFVLGAQSELPGAERPSEDDDEDYDSDYCCSQHSLSDLDSDAGSHAHGSHAGSSASDFERRLPFELLVTRVCTRWRAVAVEVPALWCNIVFQHPFKLEKAAEYVRRAKGAPLEISIDCTVDEEEMEDEESGWWNDEEVVQKEEYRALVDILNVLTPHVEQWKGFDLSVSHYLLMQHALEVFASCPGAPILEVFGLYHYEEADDELESFIPEKFKEQNFVLFQNNVPKLKEVALWGVHLNWERTTFLSGLRSIELAYHAPDVRPSYRDFLRILKSSPQLHTLALCQSGPAGMPVEWLASVQQDHNPDERITESLLTANLPSVESLVLAFLPPDYVLALHEWLRVPNVTELALDFDHDEYAPVVDRFAEPAPGTSKALFAGVEALKLSGLPCARTAAIVKAAGALQRLRQLIINFTHVEYTWFDLLTAPEKIAGAGIAPGTVFFPRLEAVSITALEGREVREIVEKRMAAGKPLKEVYLNQEDIVYQEDEEWLKENLEVFERFEGSEDEDDDDIDLDLDLDDVDEEDIVEDDQDEEWTDEDEDDDFNDSEDEMVQMIEDIGGF